MYCPIGLNIKYFDLLYTLRLFQDTRIDRFNDKFRKFQYEFRPYGAAKQIAVLKVKLINSEIYYCGTQLCFREVFYKN